MISPTISIKSIPTLFRTKLNGFKITYSGDTRPNSDIVELGMGSDLLIHEATYARQTHNLDFYLVQQHS